MFRCELTTGGTYEIEFNESVGWFFNGVKTKMSIVDRLTQSKDSNGLKEIHFLFENQKTIDIHMDGLGQIEDNNELLNCANKAYLDSQFLDYLTHE